MSYDGSLSEQEVTDRVNKIIAGSNADIFPPAPDQWFCMKPDGAARLDTSEIHWILAHRDAQPPEVAKWPPPGGSWFCIHERKVVVISDAEFKEAIRHRVHGVNKG